MLILSFFVVLILGSAFWARNRKIISQELWRPLFVGIVCTYLGSLTSFFITKEISNRQKIEQKAELDQLQLILKDKNTEITQLNSQLQMLINRKPEIPITVEDKATGNQLYIGRPIPRLTHYEFPIILNDGQGSYRIDQYNILNQFKGVLIIKKE